MAETKISDPNLAALLAAFQESIKTIVAEIRKPPFDPVKEAQKLREHETKVANLKAYWERKTQKKKNCAHSRQDGTCVIAWAKQSDEVTRGYCPNCDSTFGPDDGELYKEQLRRPRGLQESVRVVA
jgi:hypothetical protein